MILTNSAQRLLLAGGFTLAITAAPIVAALSASAPGPGTPAVATCPVDGIPCNGSNTGLCIGLSENNTTAVPQPKTSISSSQ